MKHNVAIGDRFGRWTVIAEWLTRGDHRASRCKCECGTERLVNLSSLANGASTSCGCYIRELHSARRLSHGHTAGANNARRTPEYRAWRHIKIRCENPASKAFAYYGGRGITMCDRWRDSFEAFYADMGPKPSADHSIDRIDVNAHYEPANCRWATKRQQANNTRASRFLTCDGETLTVAEWAARTGIDRNTIAVRLDRLKWSVEQALHRSVRSRA